MRNNIIGSRCSDIGVGLEAKQILSLPSTITPLSVQLFVSYCAIPQNTLFSLLRLLSPIPSPPSQSCLLGVTYIVQIIFLTVVFVYFDHKVIFH